MTDHQLRQLARTVLTPEQYEAWDLHINRRCSYGVIALILNRDKSTIRDRIRRAERRLDRHLCENPPDGNVRPETARRPSIEDAAGAAAP